MKNLKSNIHKFKTEIKNCTKPTPWDLGNNILYSLCKKYSSHDKIEYIIAKIWLVGRAYAAAIERRKTKNEMNDNFYVNVVGKKILEANIDNQFNQLKRMKTVKDENITTILETHKFLSDEFKKLTGMDKRSLSSKYLHFHFPNLFFLYDTRAVSSLRKFISILPKDYKEIIKNEKVDNEYANFFCKAFIVKKEIKSEMNMEISNRQLDNFLLGIAYSNKNHLEMKNTKKHKATNFNY